MREAFWRLSAESLLRVIPQIGTFVALISNSAIHDAQLIRETLECGAVADHPAFFGFDEQMHRQLMLLAGHPFIWQVITSAKAQLDRVRFFSPEQDTWPSVIFDQNDSIIDRVARHDSNGAAESMTLHLRTVVPAAAAAGVRMCIHPNDPPRPLLGLPRICSSAEDIAFILDAVVSPSNGLTPCTGSLGAAAHHDVPELARRFANRIAFVHLRNVAKEPDGSLMEADHLGGDTDMVAVVHHLLREQQRRNEANNPRWRLPFRPDHGHELLDDVGKSTHPGYRAIGRLRGLAEIRGVMTALAHQHGLPM